MLLVNATTQIATHVTAMGSLEFLLLLTLEEATMIYRMTDMATRLYMLAYRATKLRYWYNLHTMSPTSQLLAANW